MNTENFWKISGCELVDLHRRLFSNVNQEKTAHSTQQLVFFLFLCCVNDPSKCSFVMWNDDKEGPILGNFCKKLCQRISARRCIFPAVDSSEDSAKGSESSSHSKSRRTGRTRRLTNVAKRAQSMEKCKNRVSPKRFSSFTSVHIARERLRLT